MIYKIRIPQQCSFVKKADGIYDKTIQFTDNINVIIGPKNSGKSTLIKGLAAYSAISFGYHKKAGWSSVSNYSYDSDTFFPRAMINNFNDKDKFDAFVDWDGTPSFLFDGYMSESVKHESHIYQRSNSPDELTSKEDKDYIDRNLNASVEYILFKINFSLKNELNNVPVLNNSSTSSYYSNKSKEAFLEYLNKLSKTYRVTLLMDNFDNAFDAKDSYTLWNRHIPELQEACNLQIITTSRSITPALLGNKIFNIIELKENYIKTIAKYNSFFAKRYLNQEN